VHETKKINISLRRCFRGKLWSWVCGFLQKKP
jgi:hypothetical protein